MFRQYFLRLKRAFTLAEVLITIGVIGVVAAITIPSLVTSYQKRMTVNRLKGSYSKLAQALEAASEDYGPVSDWEYDLNDSVYDSQKFQEKYQNALTGIVQQRIIPYAKVIEDCGLNCPQRAKLKICSLSGVCSKQNQRYWTYTIYLADGSCWEFMVDNIDGKLTTLRIYIDINGEGKPNVFGRDIFVVGLNGSVHLEGFSSKRESLLGTCRTCCSKESGDYAGYSCGGLIQRDGWQIMPDYPWK